MTPSSAQDATSLILQSTLAMEAVFFALFTLVAVLLNDTATNIRDSEEKQKALRDEYEHQFQALDMLDPRRQRASEALRGIQRTIVQQRSRSRLLSGTLMVVMAVIVIATFVTVYSFARFNVVHVDRLLQVTFYIVLVAPLVSTLAIVWVVRELAKGQ